MRRMISQKLQEAVKTLVENGGASWVLQMKDLISYDEESGIYTDVPITFDGSLNLGTIMQLLNTTSEEPFFPDLSDQAGKVVVVNDDETGFEYVEKGTKLYKHTIEDAYGDEIVIISTHELPYTAQDFIVQKQVCRDFISAYDFLDDTFVQNIVSTPTTLEVNNDATEYTLPINDTVTPL